MTKRNRTIFLDMDGVVADFVGGVLALNESCPSIIEKFKGDYDIVKHLNMTPSDFWGKIDTQPTFWQDLQKTEEADQLIAFLEERIDSKDIYFLTSPSLHPNSHYGKAHWIKTHYPRYSNRLILTGHKHFLAGQNRILIDDSDENCSKFKTHGGQAILFPRKWNAAFLTRTQDILDETFRELTRLL